MRNKIQRAVDALEVGAAIGKPKPEKKTRPKVKRKLLEKQIEAMVKAIIFWRDGQECVQKATDGAKCGNGLSWGHYQAQKQSSWLRYDLGNVFVQCGNHNLLDHNGDKSYSLWFIHTFGQAAADAMIAEARAHSGGNQRPLHELEEMLAHYDELYQNRFYVGGELAERIAAGYYGEIVKRIFNDL